MYMLEQRRIAYIQATTTDHIYHLKPQEKEPEKEPEKEHIRLKTKEERIQIGKELRLEREAGYRQQQRDDDADYMSYVPVKLVPKDNLPIKKKEEKKEESSLFYSRFILPVRIKMG